MMYHVDFLTEDDLVLRTVSHSADDETIWLNAGFDLLDRRGQRAEDFEMDLIYALDRIDDQDVLDFLGRLVTECIRYPDATIRVRF